MLVSPAEKAAEYESGKQALHAEKLQVTLEANRKPRRKVPKPGCYPLGFSLLTMSKAACTLSLHELRCDLSMVTSAAPAFPSFYFEEVDCPEQVKAHARQSKRVCETVSESPTERVSRRKVSHGEYVIPRSAAEERRQLQAVLQRSMQDQPKNATVPASTQHLSITSNSSSLWTSRLRIGCA